jgi:hypothetical protein
MKKLVLLLGLIAVVVLAVALYAGLGLQIIQQAVAQEGVDVPFLDDWASGGHADAAAEAFIHWDEDSPAEVPANCAKCHSTPGYLDFLGADGTEFGAVDGPHEIGTTIECVACHNEVTLTMDSVVMPSGLEITDLGDEARCMQCHQGRESKVSVDQYIADSGVTDEDTVSADLGFRNVHYFAAAATKYGTMAKGGYEYDGNAYDGNFAHVEEFDTCIECHDTHTLEVKVEECSACHSGVTDVEDLKDVRMAGSLVDYDGDGDMREGIYYELDGLRETLYGSIQAYADEVSGAAITYDPASHPYFFDDAGEAYASWTPRLLKAAYNYQVATKDPGAFAHGGKYIIELLYDSIADLNTAIATPVDMEAMSRIDHGHFAGSQEAFRHWDEEGEVPGSCSKCHSAEGLSVFIKDGASVSQHVSNGFQCTTCHESISLQGSVMEAPRYEVTEVEFPSGLTIDAESADANTLLCMNCHQGRESTVSVNAAIEGSGAGNDEVSDKLGFRNIHYFPAGVTRYGTEAKGAYEFDGQTYNGLFMHWDDGAPGCTDCHDTHALEVEVDTCGDCHEGVSDLESLQTIRVSDVDYDGDGDTSEGVAGEIATIQEALYAAIQAYASGTVGTGIEYDPAAYPYFFDEAGTGYASWTPSLLRAAYNYQYSVKDPGTFAHNPEYVIQVLMDSIDEVGGDTSGMTRPEVR